MFAYVVRRIFVGIVMLAGDEPGDVRAVLRLAGRPGAFACGKNCSPVNREAGTQVARLRPAGARAVDQTSSRGSSVGRDYPDDPELRKAARPETVTHCAAPCLGYSTSAPRRSTKWSAQAIPVTFSLALAALILWVVVGVLSGSSPRSGRARSSTAASSASRCCVCLPGLLHRHVPAPIRRDQVGPLADAVLRLDRRRWRGGVVHNLVLPAITLALSTWRATCA